MLIILGPLYSWRVVPHSDNNKERRSKMQQTGNTCKIQGHDKRVSFGSLLNSSSITCALSFPRMSRLQSFRLKNAKQHIQ